MNTRAVIYSRVSTDLQSYERQTRELLDYSTENNIEVVKVYEEKISGYKKSVDRPTFTQMINELKDMNVEMVLTSELSRIGRSVPQVISFIEELNSKGICLYIHDNKIRTIDADGKVNHMTMFMLSILSATNALEKQILVSRLQSGRAAYIKKSLEKGEKPKIGRPLGKKTKDEFLSKHSDIIRHLNKGMSIRNTAKLCDKGISTVQRVKQQLAS